MKKIIIFLLLCLLTGCNSYTELNDLAIIKSIGISYQENQYTLYAEIIDEIEKDDLPKTKIINLTGDKIETLFDEIKLSVNKEIYLSHIDLIILSDNLNNDHLHEIIQYFLNNKELRNDFLCVYSDNIQKVLENSKYDEIEELITTNKDSKDVINITFEEIIKDFLDYQSFKISFITYDQEIKFIGNILYQNNKVERIYTNENKN